MMLALGERGPIPESLSVAANRMSPEKSLATNVFRSIALWGGGGGGLVRKAVVMMTDREEDREKWSKEVKEGWREGRAEKGRLRAM